MARLQPMWWWAVGPKCLDWRDSVFLRHGSKFCAGMGKARQFGFGSWRLALIPDPKVEELADMLGPGVRRTAFCDVADTLIGDVNAVVDVAVQIESLSADWIDVTQFSNLT